MRALALLPLAATLLAGCIVQVQPAVLCADAHSCGPGAYCDFPQGDACGHEGSVGICEDPPSACPPYQAVVCGCDGTTYESPCIAHLRGTDVARAGACDDACVAADAHAIGICETFLGWYWDGVACVALSGCWCNGVDCARGAATAAACAAAHGTCTSVACDATRPCDAGSFCDHADASSCGTTQAGVCRPRPTACPPVVHPVCGCDGVTYPSACDANVAGTDAAYDGSCAMGSCGGFAGFACTSSQFCDYPAGALCGAADQTGVCRPRPDACSAIYAPVCGCDGVTYANECAANAAGVDAAFSGSCESAGNCGGAAGATCASTEWCDVADGAACDASGVCRPRPTVCPDYYSPTCGCDGTTYSNPCDAEAAGTDVAYPGACATPADCRSLGCSAGATCSACLTATGVGWVCLPSGAVC